MNAGFLAEADLCRPSGDDKQQYGALAWRTDRADRTKIMLITSRRQRRWTIPKGSPDKDEPGFMTASREAFEGAGIIGDIATHPLTDYSYLKRLDDGSLEPCRVTVFSMKVYGTISHWREQGEREREWFSIEEASSKLDDTELAEFVRAHGPFPGRPKRSRPKSWASVTLPHVDHE